MHWIKNESETIRGSSKWRDKNISILFQAEARSLEIQRFGFMAQITVWVREHKDKYNRTLALSSECAPCVNLDVINVMVVVVWGANLLCCCRLCVYGTGSAHGSQYPSREMKNQGKKYKKMLIVLFHWKKALNEKSLTHLLTIWCYYT